MGDIEDYGNPRRGTNPNPAPEDDSQSSSSGSDRDRKKRVTVTPSDYAQLEAAADELGLSKAGVYNLAFKRLLNELNLDV